MTCCPLCDYQNIPGTDLCEQCGQSLHNTHLRPPQNAVERGLLVDALESLDPKPPVVARPDTPVQQVLRLLVENHIGCVLIVDDGRLVGIFSERDALLRLNAAAADYADQPISRFMTPNPQVLQETNKLAFAVHRMDLGGFRHVPVVNDQGAPTGVISVRDILRYLADKNSTLR